MQDMPIKGYPDAIPFPSYMLARLPFRQRIKKNHGRDLDEVIESGGLHPSEIAAILEDRDYRPMLVEDAFKVMTNAIIQERDRMTLQQRINERAEMLNVHMLKKLQ